MEDYLLHTSYLLSVRSVRQVMDQVFAFLLWPKREAYMGHENKEAKKQGSTVCCTDWANEATKMFIIWLCWLFRFWKDDRELEVCTVTYGPGIDQSQHTKSVRHIIIVITIIIIVMMMMMINAMTMMIMMMIKMDDNNVQSW